MQHIPDVLEEPWGPVRLFREAQLDDDRECALWCIEARLIPIIGCHRHRIARDLVSRPGRQHPVWYCGRCRDRISATRATIFEDSHLPLGQILMLAYSWAHGCSYDATRANCIFDRGQHFHSDETIAHWFATFQDRVVDYAEHFQNDGPRIGGPCQIVQIDEALIGRRKYNRGRVVEGTWVVGMVAQNGQLRLERCPGNRRTSAVLHEMISRHVEPGSEIHTDGWRAYQGLENLGYTHRVVNHSVEFVAPDGTHTQRIESQWRGLRRMFTPGGRRHQDMASNLIEYLWRRDCHRLHIDTFASLLVILRH